MKLTTLLILSLVLLAFVVAEEGGDDGGGDDEPEPPWWDFIGAINALPGQIIGGLTGAFSDLLKQAFVRPISDMVSGSYAFLANNPPVANAETRAAYDDLLTVVETVFVISLLWSALRLMFSQFFGRYERSAAKENVRRVFVSMFLVWISFDLYALVIEFTNSIAAFLAPTSSEWSAIISNAFSSDASFVLFILAFIPLAIFLILSILRWIFVYLGLFLFPIALVLESISYTAGFGAVLKGLVTANFVAQFIDVLFLKVLIVLAAGASGASVGISDASFRILIVLGILVLLILIHLAVYVTALLEPVFKNQGARMAVMAAV